MHMDSYFWCKASLISLVSFEYSRAYFCKIHAYSSCVFNKCVCHSLPISKQSCISFVQVLPSRASCTTRTRSGITLLASEAFSLSSPASYSSFYLASDKPNFCKHNSIKDAQALRLQSPYLAAMVIQDPSVYE